MHKIIYLLLIALVMFTGSSAVAQGSIVMKAFNGGIKLNGGSTVQGHDKEIDVLSISNGAIKCDTCNRSGFQAVYVMLTLSPALTTLRKLMLNGTPLTSIDLTYIIGNSPGTETYRTRLENVIVESVQESASGGIPTFSVSFLPARMAWQQITDATHKTSYGWDIVNNVEWLYY